MGSSCRLIIFSYTACARDADKARWGDIDGMAGMLPSTGKPKGRRGGESVLRQKALS